LTPAVASEATAAQLVRWWLVLRDPQLNGLIERAVASALDMLANLTARFHDFGSNASLMAVKEMSLLARREATVMSFSDVFLMMTALFVALAALAVVMKRPAAPAGAGAGGH
jgi:hypothetical protein